MYYTTIKLENDLLFFLQNGGLTDDVLERCKNRWSYGLVSLVQKPAKYVSVFENIHF